MTCREQKTIIYRRTGQKKLNKSTSINRAAASTAIPCSSVHKILYKKLKMTPFKNFHLQQLFDSDLAARNAMCTELLNLIEDNEHFLSKICFSDEATFHLHERVNRHNCVIWGTENPKEVKIKIKSGTDLRNSPYNKHYSIKLNYLTLQFC